MTKIIYFGDIPEITTAVVYANDVLNRPEFWEAIEAESSFELSKKTPREISVLLQSKTRQVIVKTYRPGFLRHRNTLAYVSSAHPNIIFYNLKKIGRSIGAIVNTLIHEYVHCVDYFEDGNILIEYGHGSQTSIGKANTAPYWIGNLAERIFNSNISTIGLNVAATPPPEYESEAANENSGFSGEPLTRWNGRRNMIVMEDFHYIDPSGKQWSAPRGSTINGASIPQFLWSTLGGPYSGCYRRAAVIHDAAVSELSSRSERKDADRMFYHACRHDGCSRRFSAILYTGVRFGSWVARSPEVFKPFPTELEATADFHDLEQHYLMEKFAAVVNETEGLIDHEHVVPIDLVVEESNLDALDEIIDECLNDVPAQAVLER